SAVCALISLVAPPALASVFFSPCCRAPPALHSFPTRRSSDLRRGHRLRTRSPRDDPAVRTRRAERARSTSGPRLTVPTPRPRTTDRKSTRLKSSHVKISYAVFCLKKKKTKTKTHAPTDISQTH